MMQFTSFLLFLSIFFTTPQKGESDSWKILKTIKKKADFISTDRLGNLYIVNANNIWRYNNNGDSIAAFNSRKYGEISHIDTTDPYKILVFFRDYGLILFLDNYLSENGESIDLQELGFDQVIMACQSREAGFWIYDQLKQKAFHLNEEFKTTHESVNLAQWFQKRIMPTGMIEFNNQLYMNEKESGIYVFDHFATYLKKIPLDSIKHMQVLEQGINFLNEDEFCEYEMKSFITDCQSLPKKGAIDARVEKNRFYCLYKDEAIIYKTN